MSKALPWIIAAIFCALWMFDRYNKGDNSALLQAQSDSLRRANKAIGDSLEKVTILYRQTDSTLSATLNDTIKTHEKQRTVLLTHAALPADSATQLFLDRFNKGKP